PRPGCRSDRSAGGRGPHPSRGGTSLHSSTSPSPSASIGLQRLAPQFIGRDNEHVLPARIGDVDDAEIAARGCLTDGHPRTVCARPILTRVGEGLPHLLLCDAVVVNVGLARVRVVVEPDCHRPLLGSRARRWLSLVLSRCYPDVRSKVKALGRPACFSRFPRPAARSPAPSASRRRAGPPPPPSRPTAPSSGTAPARTSPGTASPRPARPRPPA